MKVLGVVLAGLGFGVVFVLISSSGFEQDSDCELALAANSELSGEAAANAAVIVEAGKDAPVEAQQIALAVALVESGLINVAGGDRDSIGLFQQRPSQGWGTPAQISDPTYSAAKFYEALLGLEGWEQMPPGDAAQAVQRSAFPARYGQAMPEARRVHAETTNTDISETSGTAGCVGSGGVGLAASGEQLKVSTAMGSEITVDASLAPSLQQLLDDAAAQGIVLAGWGWRDPQSQIRLRKEHCGTTRFAIYEMSSSACSPPTARPGRSQHEIGLAVDFTCRGASISSRSSVCFRWLAANAERYGLENLPAEPWHWSTTGR